MMIVISWVELHSGVVDGKDERAYSSITRCPISSPWRQFSEIICFTLVIVVQLMRSTVIGGIICSWITDTYLEGRDFALDSCELLTQELFLLLAYGGNYFL